MKNGWRRGMDGLRIETDLFSVSIGEIRYEREEEGGYDCGVVDSMEDSGYEDGWYELPNMVVRGLLRACERGGGAAFGGFGMIFKE